MFKTDVLLQRFDEEAILVDLDTETIFQLNQTGARIAELIIEERSVPEILAILDREFEKNSSDIERDVLAFLDELLTHDLVVEPPTRNLT